MPWCEEEARTQGISYCPLPVQLKRLHAEAAALLGVALPAVEAAPEPAAKVAEAKEPSKSTPAPEAAIEEEKLGRQEKALADLNKVIELEPKNPKSWARRARLYVNLGQWEKAIADYDQALACQSDNANVCTSLAWYLATCPDPRVRRPDRAVELAKKATQLAPNDGNHWNNLGVAQYQVGDYKATVETLTKSMGLRSGGDAFDWFFLAMALGQLGKPEEARQWYQKAVAWTQTNKPDDVELRRFQAEAAALLGVTLPAAEPAPEPAGKVEEAQEMPKSTPAPEAAKEEEQPK